MWCMDLHQKDCHLKTEDGEIDYNNVVEVLIERIFDDVGNIDYIYQVIQECVDEVTEEQYMNYQQELEEVGPPDQSGPLPLLSDPLGPILDPC